MRKRIVVSSALFVLALIAGAARADNGAGSLYVAGATYTPTHWNVTLGSTVCAEIRGVSAAEVGTPLPATLTVWVKSSTFGNTMVTATQIGTSSDYAFCYTPPTAAADGYEACGTTIVAYQSLGTNSNNDYLDDGLKNGSSVAASGFRFVDAAGMPIDCVTVGVQGQPWGTVKGLYR